MNDTQILAIMGIVSVAYGLMLVYLGAVHGIKRREIYCGTGKYRKLLTGKGAVVLGSIYFVVGGAFTATGVIVVYRQVIRLLA